MIYSAHESYSRYFMLTKVLAMILAGGEGKRLYPLTKERTKPAVPFGGRYRIIDFALNNFVNSGYYKIKILTQFKSDSLIRHLSRGWTLSSQLGHYMDPVPAQMRMGKEWYKGTADAIYQNLNLIRDEDPAYVCVFAGDHIYKMDIKQMLVYHINKKADLTIAAVPKPIDEARQYGVIEIDSDSRIISFEEKPEHPKHMPGNPLAALVSMGNYIFNTKKIVEELKEDAAKESGHDFGRDIIKGMYKKCGLYVYDFMNNAIEGMSERERGYWKDVGSIDAYWQANMDLVSVSPVFDLYSKNWPLRTYYPPLPPAKFIFSDDKTKRIGIATDSLVSEGCIISGGQINRSILSPGVRINSYSYVSESILMKDVNIGRYAKIKKAIIDKFVNIPPKMEIGYDLERDRKRFYVTDSGIVVIPKGTNVQ